MKSLLQIILSNKYEFKRIIHPIFYGVKLSIMG